MTPQIHIKLLNALTAFDRKEAKKKHYNRYALAQYCAALQSAQVDMDCGATLRESLLVNFIGHLLSALLRAVGEPDFTRDEMHFERTWIVPEVDEE